MPGAPSALAVLTAEQLAQALEPLRVEIARVRDEIAALRASREAEGVTPAEAARRLGVSLRTVQRQIRTGAIPSVQIGRARRVRLPPSDE